MKSCSGAGVKVVFIAVLVALGGCATFSVDDAYRPSGSDQQDFIEMVGDGAKLRVSFVPETKFFSVGLVVPMVPLGASAERSKEVAMKVLATLPAGQPFSFAPVCLDAPPSRLCPQSVQVGIAYYYGEPTQHGPGFVDWNHAQPWEIDATAPIADQDIFKHRPFRGERDWTRMELEIIYTYVCDGQCPDELSLATDQLLLLRGKNIGAGVQKFRWRRKADYGRVIVQ